MILPRLCINGSIYRVELYYPEEPNEPIAIMSGSAKSSCDLFANMLYMALENYDDGYDIGYNDAIEDMEGGEFEEVDELDETKRGDGAFGSTGT